MSLDFNSKTNQQYSFFKVKLAAKPKDSLKIMKTVNFHATIQ